VAKDITLSRLSKSQDLYTYLRGGAEQFMKRSKRSLHDAIMVVKRAVKNGEIVAGGRCIEVCIGRFAFSMSESEMAPLSSRWSCLHTSALMQ